MKRFSLLRPGLATIALALAILTPVPSMAQVDLQLVEGDHIAIVINGQPFSSFYIGSSYPKPFLAPLRAATGQIVTRKYPMETVAGETTDHPHHRGLFIGYGSISGVNFWENELNYTDDKYPNRGRIVARHVGDLKSGKKSGSIAATFEWRDPGGADMMDEERVTTFYALPEERIIDVDSAFSAKVDLTFGDTKEGFFAIRLADSLAEKNGGMMTNAEGAQTEKSVWGKRSDWVDYDGTVDGQKVGIVIFDHPGNPNHPPRWHSRAYGLFAVNPFGVKDFDKSDPGQGGMALHTGEVLRFRYRVIIHRGDVPEKKVAQWYVDYKKKVK